MSINKIKKKSSFTLIELVITVTIVLTLATIAIPAYNKSKAKAISKEAISNIRLLAAAERINRMENNVYATCADAASCNSLFKLMLNTTNWLYAVTGDTSAVTATATYQPDHSCTYSLSSANFDADPTKTGGGSCP